MCLQIMNIGPIRVRRFLFAILLTVSPIILFATDLYITTTGLNVRTEAGTKHPVSFVLKKGDKVEVLSSEGRWYKIRHLGKTGYANSKYLTKSKLSQQSESNSPESNNLRSTVFIALILLCIAIFAFNRWQFDIKRKQRRDYYRNVYLKSDEWQRKRYVVFRRDNWRCVYCGAPATEVHHKRSQKGTLEKSQ